ncbi:unnamed protein product [Larinioides sclopetarius]|uniref:Uncharacterized protein n=1 Tax=Larinioides sclopetarius TaxID=280406 RepID=A0AAV1ZF04_9ARAC
MRYRKSWQPRCYGRRNSRDGGGCLHRSDCGGGPYSNSGWYRHSYTLHLSTACQGCHSVRYDHHDRGRHRSGDRHKSDDLQSWTSPYKVKKI